MEYHIDPETLIPTAPLPRLRQAERRIEVLEASKRDLELQRDELLCLIEKACAFLRSGHADVAKNIFDSGLAYCLEFTPAERAEDALEQYSAQAAQDEANAARHGG